MGHEGVDRIHLGLDRGMTGCWDLSCHKPTAVVPCEKGLRQTLGQYLPVVDVFLLTRRAQVRRQASLSLPWVFPFLREWLRLDVWLVSLSHGSVTLSHPPSLREGRGLAVRLVSGYTSLCSQNRTGSGYNSRSPAAVNPIMNLLDQLRNCQLLRVTPLHRVSKKCSWVLHLNTSAYFACRLHNAQQITHQTCRTTWHNRFARHRNVKNKTSPSGKCDKDVIKTAWQRDDTSLVRGPYLALLKTLCIQLQYTVGV